MHTSPAMNMLVGCLTVTFAEISQTRLQEQVQKRSWWKDGNSKEIDWLIEYVIRCAIPANKKKVEPWRWREGIKCNVSKSSATNSRSWKKRKVVRELVQDKWKSIFFCKFCEKEQLAFLCIIYFHLTEDAKKLVLNALFSQYIIQSGFMLCAGGILILL